MYYKFTLRVYTQINYNFGELISSLINVGSLTPTPLNIA